MQQFQLFKDDTRYAYAVGRIRVLETRLLDSSALQRMLESDSPRAALESLSDTEYETSLSKIEREWDFEAALRVEMERVYELIDSLSQDQELTNIFRIKWDFHNLKALLKKKHLQSVADIETRSADVGDILVQSGLEDLEELTEAVMSEDGDIGHLPQYLQEAIIEVESEFETGDIDPQLIDIILDKHLQSLNYRRATEYSDFLKGYFQSAIDLYNIRNFLRVKILNKDRDFLSKVLLDNGVLKAEFFLNQFEDSSALERSEGIENFAEAIKHTNYYELVTEGIQSWTENNSFATLEQLSDNYLLNYIKPAKFAILGVEPLLGYLLAKEHETKLIRIIMIGKLNGLTSESIRERLRETYV